MQNFTCYYISKHLEQWLLSVFALFAPTYPPSIRGMNDQRGTPGGR